MDVEFNLPPKKEYVLYAPLSIRQREAYDRVLDGGLRKWLIHGGTGGDDVVKDTGVQDEENKTNVDESLSDEEHEDEDSEKAQKPRTSKRAIKGGRKSYNVDDDDDDEYFEMLEQGHIDERGLKVLKTREEEQAEEAQIGREHQARAKSSFLWVLFFLGAKRINDRSCFQ